MAAYSLRRTLIIAAVIAIAATNPTPESHICASCNFSNGVGYVADPTNCHNYIMCAEPQGKDGYRTYTIPCASGLYWRQDLMTCSVDSDGLHPCPTEGCQEIVQTYEVCPTVVPPTDGTVDYTDPPCNFWVVPGFPKLYFFMGHVMPCPEGTIFYPENCLCQRNNTAGNCGEDPMLRYPLTGSFASTQCLGGTATPYNNPNTTDYLCLDGQTQRVEIGFLKNWFVGNNVQGFTISLWFLANNMSSPKRQGLFGNGDCNKEASLQIYLEDGTVMGKLVTTEGSANLSDVSQMRKYKVGEWNHVALVYTGWSLEMWLNGQFAGACGAISGAIAETQLATTLGLTYTRCQPNFFKGCMCDLRVYKRVVYMMEMEEIYSKGGCHTETVG